MRVKAQLAHFSVLNTTETLGKKKGDHSKHVIIFCIFVYLLYLLQDTFWAKHIPYQGECSWLNLFPLIWANFD